MTNTQTHRNGTSDFARLSAAVLFVTMVGMGYAISPRVEGAVAQPAAVADEAVQELPDRVSDCAIGGLVFAGCNLDF